MPHVAEPPTTPLLHLPAVEVSASDKEKILIFSMLKVDIYVIFFQKKIQKTTTFIH